MKSLVTVHNRGRYDVVGWLVLTSVHGEDGARARIAQLWEPGCTVRRVSVGYWLALPAAQRLRGPFPAVVVRNTAFGPSALSVEAPSAEGAGVWIAVPGGCRREPGEVVHPSDWLQWTFQPVEVASLAAPETTEPVGFEERPLRRADVGLPEPTPAEVAELAALSHSLRAATNGADDGERAPLLRTVIKRLLRPVAKVLDTVAHPTSTGSRPEWMTRWGQWLDRWLEPWLRSRHDAYLRELTRLFEVDTELALRRAVPLWGEGEVGRLLRQITHRDNLLEPGVMPATGTGNLSGSAQAMERLRRQYRQTALQLEQEGDIRKAAFVLSNLLGEHARAIRLCREHGLYDVAAQLAEHKGPAEEAVVLWALHGDIDRAVDIAIRSRCYSQALRHFNAGEDQARNRLRRAWAMGLAEGGALLRAIEVASDVPDMDALLDDWVDAAVAQGSMDGAKARVHRLRRRGERADALALRQWMHTASSAERAMLLAACEPLGTGDVLAVQTYRALARQALPFVQPFAGSLPAGCLEDIVQSTTLHSIEDLEETDESSLPLGDAPIVAAHLLPSQLVVVNTGRDVRVYDLRGTEVFRQRVQADRIVVPKSGSVVLLVEVDVDVTDTVHVYRFDTFSGACVRWVVLSDVPTTTHYANGWHDGVWWVVQRDRLLGLDVRTDAARALVEQKGIDAVRLLTVGPDGRSVAVLDACQDIFVFRAPRWRLQERHPPTTAVYDQLMRSGTVETEDGPNVAAFDRDWETEHDTGQVRVIYDGRLVACLAVWA